MADNLLIQGFIAVELLENIYPNVSCRSITVSASAVPHAGFVTEAYNKHNDSNSRAWIDL